MRLVTISALITYALVFTTCRKSQGIDPAKSETVFDLFEFPLKINNEWVYLRKDFYNNTTDTLTLAIKDMLYSGDDSSVYLCMLSIDNEYVDSAVFEVRNNSIAYHSIAPSGYSYFGEFIINFPFSENSYWLGNNIPDTIRVNSLLETVKVQDSIYKNVFYIKRAYSLIGGYSIVQSLQISRNIGIIKQNIDLFNSGIVQKQGFDLISYKLY